MPADRLAVVADIGGTNTRVALAHGPAIDAGSIRRFRNADAVGIDPILRAYLAETGAAPQAVCVDIAGPVRHGVGRLTNLDWVVTPDGLRDATGAEAVAVLNDMQAQGIGVAHLPDEGLRVVLDAPQPGDPDAPRLVVNLGTGLNAQPVLRRHGETLVPPAEAGHVSIPVATAEELALRDWLQARLGFAPGLEEALSGRGFEAIYAWVCESEGHASSCTAREILSRFHAGEAAATRAARVMVQLLGRYTGDLALITLPFGGIYLVGGVTRHLAPHLTELGFAEAFAAKGRFSEFMGQFGVRVVSDDYAALTGCAAHLDEMHRSAP